MPAQFDREAENLGNVTMLEHLNVEIPNQALASNFYLVGCGFTRDPVPVSRHQQYVGQYRQEPVPPADRRRPGVPRPYRHRDAEPRAAARPASPAFRSELADSKFSFEEHNDYVEATCPWGNQFRFYEPDEERFGKINLGIPYVEFTVPEGTAKRIARFYRKVLGALTDIEKNGEGKAAHIKVGPQPGADLPRDRPATAGI